MIRIRAAAHTDIGKVRQENEDRFLLDETAMLYGVADGIGGLPGGAEAAQECVDAVRELVGLTPDGELPDMGSILRRTNERVNELSLKVSPRTGIGATLTVGHVRGATMQIAHVGDSRCYGWREGGFVMLTEDHSMENEVRRRRARGETVYSYEVNRNALTRCIGQPTPVEVDLLSRPLQAGDRYLFCTDGISRVVRNNELAELVAQSAEPAEILTQLVALALRRGGPDNATAVLMIVDALD